MKFHERKYDVFVLLGHPDSRPLWQWTRWTKAAAAISPVIAASRGPASVRCFQYANGADVKFGRILWSLKGHEKWAHGSRTNKAKSAHWKFMGLEVSAPLWAACERENKPPDMFFSLTNLELWGVASPAYNPVVVLAIALDDKNRLARAGDNAVSVLRKLLDAKLVLNKKRLWGKSWGRSAFTDGIQDFPGGGFFKPGIDHVKEPTSKSFVEKWATI